jgi:hypothetical protein
MRDPLQPPSEDIPSLWTQYEKLIDLHKFYFENIIRAETLYLGVEGAILTYIIGAKFDEKLIPIVLIFPLLLSIGALIISAIGMLQTRDLSSTVNRLQEELHISWRPHVEVLVYLTTVFTILSLLATAGISWLLFFPSLIALPAA